MEKVYIISFYIFIELLGKKNSAKDLEISFTLIENLLKEVISMVNCF